MKIQDIYIKGFGKFKDLELKFSDGLNLFYGENEAGKSTIMLFIRCMFYGVPKSQGKINKKYRDQIFPWGGDFCGGTIHFSYRDEDYRLDRQFGSSRSKDRLKLFKNNKEMAIPPKKEVGEKILGLTESAFLNSFFIHQRQIEVEDSKTGELGQKLSDLTSSLDVDISPEQAKKKLEDTRTLLISRNGKKGKIVDLKNIEMRLYEEQNQTDLLEDELIALGQEIKTLQTDYGRLDQEKIKNIDKRKKIKAIEWLKLKNNLSEQEQELTEKTTFCNSEITSLSYVGPLNTEAFQQWGEKQDFLIEEIQSYRYQLREKRNQILQQEVLLNQEKQNIDEYQALSTEYMGALPMEKYASIKQEVGVLEQTKDFLGDFKILLTNIQKKEEREKDLKELNEELLALDPVIKNLQEEQTKRIAEVDKEKESIEKKQEEEKPSIEKQKSKPFLAIGLFILAVAISVFIGREYPMYQQEGYIASGVCVVLGIILFIINSKKDQKYMAMQKERLEKNERASKILAERNQKEEELLEKKSQLEQKISEKNILGEKVAWRRSQFEEMVNTVEVADEAMYREYAMLNEHISDLKNNQKIPVNVVGFVQKELQGLIKGYEEVDETSDLMAVWDNVSWLIGEQREKLNKEKDEILNLLGCETEADCIEKQNQYLQVEQKARHLKAFVDRLHIEEKDLDKAIKKSVDNATDIVGYIFEDSEQADERIKLFKNKVKTTHNNLTQLAWISQQYEADKKKLEEQKPFEDVADYVIVSEDDVQMSAEGIDTQLELISDTLEEISNQITRLKTLYQEKEKNFKTQYEIRQEFNQNKLAIKQAERQYDSIVLAEEILDEASGILQKQISPILNEKVSNYLRKLTNDKYKTVAVNKDFDVHVEAPETSMLQRSSMFSAGTIDQIYLAIRLAITNIIGEDQEFPIFLDDVFTQYDEKRMKQGIELLYELEEKGQQSIVFICQSIDALDLSEDIRSRCNRFG